MTAAGVPRAFVLALAERAGRMAMARFRKVKGERKPDRTVVTEADRAIERMLRREIGRRFPSHGILGEEGGRSGDAGELLWALDPIDGTSAYLRGLPFFVVSIGLLRRGVPWLGAVTVPAIGETFFAVRGGGAWEGRRRIPRARDPRPFQGESLVLLPSNAHRRFAIDFPGKGRCLGSAAGQMCYAARGSADAALILGSIWDIAAGAIIVEEAGGAVRYLSGKRIDWQELHAGGVAPEPILCAHPRAISELSRRITRRP